MSPAKSDRTFEQYCTAEIEPPCEQHFTDNGKWSHIKAGSEGWFFPREGGALCKHHVPAWVPAWRERKKAQLLRGPGRTDLAEQVNKPVIALMDLIQLLYGGNQVRKGDVSSAITEAQGMLTEIKRELHGGSGD